MNARTCSSLSGGTSAARMIPPMRKIGFKPAWTWMSDALFLTAKRSRLRKSICQTPSLRREK
jgi:hypothetical protein